MKHRVLLVDDDTILTKQYEIAMALAGLDCKVFHSTASLDDCNVFSYDIIVLDLAMPAEGGFVGKDTEGGLLTGVRVAENMRSVGVTSPIIVYTNMNIDGLLKIAERVVEPLVDVLVVKKVDYTAVDLASMLSAAADSSEISKLKPSLRQKIFDSVILAPSFYGVSVDLKKLFFGK